MSEDIRDVQPDAEQEVIRLHGRVAELEQQAAALLAQCADAGSHLRVALAQSLETDDQIILGHVRDALEVLGEKERYMITIAELYAGLERDYIINRRKTLRNIKTIWEKHLNAAFGQLQAHGLSSDAVTIYIVERQNQGAKAATINRETACLQRLLKLAVNAGKLTKRPHIPHLAEQNVRRDFLRDNQVDALARETGRIGLWLRAMFEVGFTYGWRKNELLQMRVRQVDLLERSIVLDAGTTKNNEARQIQMTDAVFNLLQQCIAGKEPEGYVFTRQRESNGRKTKRRDGHIVDFRDAWETACTAAGCPGLHFHDLRRSAVRNLVRSGVAQKTAMAISGHKTPSIFFRYNIIDAADRPRPGRASAKNSGWEKPIEHLIRCLVVGWRRNFVIARWRRHIVSEKPTPRPIEGLAIGVLARPAPRGSRRRRSSRRGWL